MSVTVGMLVSYLVVTLHLVNKRTFCKGLQPTVASLHVAHKSYQPFRLLFIIYCLLLIILEGGKKFILKSRSGVRNPQPIPEV